MNWTNGNKNGKPKEKQHWRRMERDFVKKKRWQKRPTFRFWSNESLSGIRNVIYVATEHLKIVHIFAKFLPTFTHNIGMHMTLASLFLSLSLIHSLLSLRRKMRIQHLNKTHNKLLHPMNILFLFIFVWEIWREKKFVIEKKRNSTKLCLSCLLLRSIF